MEPIIAAILVLPLIGFLLISLGVNKFSKQIVSWIACSVVGIAFVLSVFVFTQMLGTHEAVRFNMFPWMQGAGLNVGFDLLLDLLSILFCMIITGVGTLIHIYSVGYMHDDARQNHFFSYLNLFIFFMLMLVMGANYLMMFIGWEGVGLCSYLLIGFWFKNTAYNHAANKAFIMNRIGDLGLLLGLFLIYLNFDSLDYNAVCNSNAALGVDTSTLTWICILLLIGAMGKSAQIPLYTWLPDAMAGPTPVSALIHAATMVTAGIYMIVRSNVLYSLAPYAMGVVMVIGLATAIFAATIGFKQNDIKKVLAYSTVSQLGLMFFALGLGNYTAGVFHVMTHAFFKALLFLGAGSVIHALHHEQDITNMGGLKDKIKITYFTFLVGTLAISGFPLLSGFFSKDEILATAYATSPVLWVLGIIASLLTVGYMFRMFFLTFWGEYRNHHVKAEDVHESPKSITTPLIILAALSIIGGVISLPELVGGNAWLHHWLEPVVNANLAPSHTISHSAEWMLMLVTTILVLAVIYLTYQFYVVKKWRTIDIKQEKGFGKILAHKYYIDEIYNAIIVKPLQFLSRLFDTFMEKDVFGGIVSGLGRMSTEAGGFLRMMQSGKLDHYVISIVMSILFLLFVLFF